MNAVYLLEQRLRESLFWGKETLKGGELNNKQLPPPFPFFDKPDTSWSPRVLKDGSIPSACSARSTASISTSGSTAKSG